MCDCGIDELVKQVKELTKMYTDMGIAEDRLIFQVPATWEGIQAVEKLEKQGICTIVQLIFRSAYLFGILQCRCSV